MCPNPPRVASVTRSFTPVQCARTPPVCQETPRSPSRPGVEEPGLRTIGARRENSHTGNMCPHQGAMAKAPVLFVWHDRTRPDGREGADRVAGLIVSGRHDAGLRVTPRLDPVAPAIPALEAALAVGRVMVWFRPRFSRSSPPDASGGEGGGRRSSRREAVPAGRAVTVRCPVAGSGPVPGTPRVPGNVVGVVPRPAGPGIRREKDRNTSCASGNPGGPDAQTVSTCGNGRATTYRLGGKCVASPQIGAPALVRTHQRQLTGTCKIFGMPRNRNTEAPRLVVVT